MLIILFVGLLLFGGEKLPEIARGLGKGIRDFKDASEGIKREINDQINNYERKEDKKPGENLAILPDNQVQQPADQGYLIDAHLPVQNTIPVNENHLFGSDSTVANSNEEAHIEPVAEHHSGVPYIDSETTTNEPVKNS
jgi:sec-independent protein translocase protein TatA